MAGNQVLEWFDIDSEIKTANLKDVRILSFSRAFTGSLTHALHPPLPIGPPRAPRLARQRGLPVSAPADRITLMEPLTRAIDYRHNWRIGELPRARQSSCMETMLTEGPNTSLQLPRRDHPDRVRLGAAAP